MPTESTLSRNLTEWANNEPERWALICPTGRLTCRELNERSWDCAAGLKTLGIGKGTRCVLMVPPGPEMVVLAFGMLRIGAVPVLVDPGMGTRYLGQCLKEADPEVFIGSPKAHAARLLFGWARKSLRKTISVGWFPSLGTVTFKKLIRLGAHHSGLKERILPDDTAAIVFTSGSTGIPKGVVYTHQMFNRQAQLLRDHFNIAPGEVDLATFPLFALFDPTWRVTTVFPEMDFTHPGRINPRNILDAIEQNGATHMFGSPALLDRVGRYCEKHRLNLPGLKRVLSAGAPVSDRVIDRFAALLPEGAHVHTPYGATEALPVCSISQVERARLSSAAGNGVCVGTPLKGVHIAIIPVTDDPITNWSDDLVLPPGEIGEIVVWGENVSAEYFRRPEANRMGKISSDDGTIRHRMGDVGYLDGSGQMWFCGRKSHRVQTHFGTLYTVPCEGVFNQHPDVFRTALVGVGRIPNQLPVLCVELEPTRPPRDHSVIREELFQLGASTPATGHIRTILFHPGFPVDIRHNSKIFREKLALWAEKEMA